MKLDKVMKDMYKEQAANLDITAARTEEIFKNIELQTGSMTIKRTRESKFLLKNKFRIDFKGIISVAAFILVIILIPLAAGQLNKKLPAQQNPVSKNQTSATDNNTDATNSQINKAVISEEEAVQKVSAILGELPKQAHLQYDHKDTLNNIEYYVIQYYEVVVDDPQTGASHEATYGWYYVDEVTGEVYKMDMSTNKLSYIPKDNKNNNVPDKNPTVAKPDYNEPDYNKIQANSEYVAYWGKLSNITISQELSTLKFDVIVEDRYTYSVSLTRKVAAPAASDISTLDGFKNALVGIWDGTVTTPWVAPYEVEFSFYADGKYSAHSLTKTNFLGSNQKFSMPALYYGTDDDSNDKHYTITGMTTYGTAVGDIAICFHQ